MRRMSKPEPRASDQRNVQSRNEIRMDWTRLFGFDIFLSYAHRDASHYALSLERELMRADLQCFRDDTNLPKGAALTKTVTDAIARSRALVVVLSEASFRSEWVGKEVRYAVSRKIDVVPINIDDAVKRNPTDSDLWRLLHEKDFTWIDDLPDAAGPHSAKPNTISAIRGNFRLKRANTFRRIAIASSFLILLAISVIALFQWKRATEQLRSARSRELLLQADALLRSEPDQVAVAALLQLEAYLNSPSELVNQQLDRSLDELALSRAWTASSNGLPTIFRIHSDAIQVTIIHPNKVETREVETGKIVRAWLLPEEILLQRDEAGKESTTPLAAIRADGAVVAYAGKSGDLLLFDLAAGRILHRIPLEWRVKDLDIAGQHVAIVTEDMVPRPESSAVPVFMVDVWSFDPTGYRKVATVEPEEADFSALHHYEVQLSMDGGTLGVFDKIHQGAGTPWPEWLMRGLTAQEQHFNFQAFSSEPNLRSGVFSPDGKTFYGLTDRNKILVMTGATSDDLDGDKTIDSKGAQSLAVSAEGKWLASTGLDGIRVWRTADLSINRTSDPQPIAFVSSAQLAGESLIHVEEKTAIGHSGCLLATVSPRNVVSIRDCIRDAVVTRIPVNSTATAVRFASGGRFVVVQTENAIESFPIEPANLTLNGQEESINEVFPIGKNLVVVCSDSNVILWDLATGQVLRQVRPGSLYADVSRSEEIPSRIQWCKPMADRSAVFFDVFDHFGSGGYSFSGVLDLLNSDRPSDQFFGQYIQLPERTSSWIVGPDEFGKLSGFDARISPSAALPGTQGNANPVWRSTVSIAGRDFFGNPNGSHIALTSGGRIQIFDSSTKKTISEWSENFPVASVRFFGTHVVTSDREMRHSVRDLGGRLIGSLVAPVDSSFVCDLAATGAYATVCTVSQQYPSEPDSGSVGLYRVSDGSRLKVHGNYTFGDADKDERGHIHLTESHSRFSASGKFWTSLDNNELVVIDVSSTSEVLRLPIRDSTSFDTNETHVALANGSDVEIYDISSGHLVHRMTHGTSVSGVRWMTPNNLLLWSSNQLRYKRLWEDPAAELCKGIKTGLNTEEWNRYFPGEMPRETCAAWRSGA
jgi:hypothetical protein